MLAQSREFTAIPILGDRVQPPAKAMERAIAIVTAYCSAISFEGDDADDIDDDAGQCLFDILYDLEQPLIDAACEGEQEMAREAFSLTIIALSSLVNALLDSLIEHAEGVDKFDLLAGIAGNHYRSMTRE